MKKISVIVPVYNVERLLARCLDSLISQTLKEIEIICVNDGSTDKSGEILKDYAKKDNRIVLVEQVNSGLSCARNSGLNIAQGEYVGFVDSDDFVEKDFYEKLYNSAKSRDAEVVCGCIVRENEKKSSILVDYKKEEVYTDTKLIFEGARVPQYCFVWNKLYKRALLEENGIKFVVGMIYEDLAFTPEVLQKAKRIVVVPNAFYHYWKHSGTLIKSSTDKSRADKLDGHKELISICNKHGVKLNIKDTLIYKRDYSLFGIKLLKEYQYRATKKYYLFGLIPIFTVKEYV